MRLLVDADVPASVCEALRAEGHDVVDARELPDAPLDDNTIDHIARGQQRILISRDMGFSNFLQYPLSPDYGRIIIRMHQVAPQQIRIAMLKVLRQLSAADLLGAIVIVQPGRFRIHRPSRG